MGRDARTSARDAIDGIHINAQKLAEGGSNQWCGVAAAPQRVLRQSQSDGMQ